MLADSSDAEDSQHIHRINVLILLCVIQNQSNQRRKRRARIEQKVTLNVTLGNVPERRLYLPVVFVSCEETEHHLQDENRIDNRFDAEGVFKYLVCVFTKTQCEGHKDQLYNDRNCEY